MYQELQYINERIRFTDAEIDESSKPAALDRTRQFNVLYKNLYLPIFHFARTFVCNQDAEDITANSFLKLWRSNIDYTYMPKVRSWLKVCTRNDCIDLLNYKKAQDKKHSDFAFLTGEEEEISDYDSDIKEKLLELLNIEIEKLPNRCKMVFKLAYLEGHTSKEIASLLEISENTVSNHRVRSFQILRVAFKPYT